MPMIGINVQLAQTLHNTLHMEAMEDVRRVETRGLKRDNPEELGEGLGGSNARDLQESLHTCLVASRTFLSNESSKLNGGTSMSHLW